jgi:hypothetical protein
VRRVQPRRSVARDGQTRTARNPLQRAVARDRPSGRRRQRNSGLRCRLRRFPALSEAGRAGGLSVAGSQPFPMTHFRHAVKENAMSRPKIFGKIANRLPCLISVSMLSICSYATTVAANEVMTDRCSREVAITPTYNDKPGAPGTVVLTRGPNGSGSWTKPFRVSLDSAGHIRWWCHSTSLTGAFFPRGIPGTCGDLLPCPEAFDGWTPERSRCGNHSTLIRARLGPDRLLQIECLGS